LSTLRTRLCIVNPSQHGGGAEYQIALLIRALNGADRFDIYYLARHVDETSPPEGYRLVRIGRSGRVPPFGYATDFFPLYRALAQIAPRVIYQRVACGYTGICALYARQHHARMIWHVAHDTDVTPQGLDVGRNLLRRRLEKWSIEFAIRHANRIVVQTRHQDELLSRHYGRSADALVANFQPEPLERAVKSPTPTVVWIANLKPWKRPEVFLRLAHALRDLVGVQFVMIGEAAGPKQEKWLDGLLRDIAAAPNVLYLGARSQDEVNEALARAWIFVNSSTQEGFPNTFIQAWLRDTVVVSLDVNPDRILDEQGLGIHAVSEERLAETVRSLLSDAAARAAYAACGRAHALAHHSVRNADALVQLIDDCARPDRPRGLVLDPRRP
jgi:glycosyltransferase involved in cell wall biosynthesis